MSDEQHAPPRLSEMTGAAGDCVRAALGRHEVPELPTFSALRERRQRRVQRQLAVGSVLLSAIAVLGVRLLHPDEAAPTVRAEMTGAPLAALEPPLARAEPAPSPVVPPLPAPRAAPPTARRSAVAPSVARVDRAKLAQPALAPAPQALDASQASGATPIPSGGARACADLARRGQAADALTCYGALSSGSGMTAELALFEQARLEGKALRHPERALEILDSYRRRFPTGSLRAEVMLARIDWLLTTGEHARARESVDEALASGLLRERTAELERLRASLAASDSQPASR